jgi:hypothetical protein
MKAFENEEDRKGLVDIVYEILENEYRIDKYKKKKEKHDLEKKG